MSDEIIKSGLCAPSGFPLYGEDGYNPELHFRQIITLSVTRNDLHECKHLSGGKCLRDKNVCLPSMRNFSRVQVLP